MKNNLLEINFLGNIIVKCNESISKIMINMEQNKKGENDPDYIILKQQLVNLIKKRKKLAEKFHAIIKQK